MDHTASLGSSHRSHPLAAHQSKTSRPDLPSFYRPTPIFDSAWFRLEPGLADVCFPRSGPVRTFLNHRWRSRTKWERNPATLMWIIHADGLHPLRIINSDARRFGLPFWALPDGSHLMGQAVQQVAQMFVLVQADERDATHWISQCTING